MDPRPGCKDEMPGLLFSLLVSAQASHMGDPNLLCVGCRGHFGFEEGFQRCPVCFELHRIQTLVEQRRLLPETGPPVAGILADTYTRLLECNTIAINRKDQSPAARESGVAPEKGEQKAHPAGSCGAAKKEESPESKVTQAKRVSARSPVREPAFAQAGLVSTAEERQAGAKLNLTPVPKQSPRESGRSPVLDPDSRERSAPDERALNPVREPNKRECRERDPTPRPEGEKRKRKRHRRSRRREEEESRQSYTPEHPRGKERKTRESSPVPVGDQAGSLLSRGSERPSEPSRPPSNRNPSTSPEPTSAPEGDEYYLESVEEECKEKDYTWEERSDSRPRSRPKEPGWGQGKHWGKNKGSKKRDSNREFWKSAKPKGGGKGKGKNKGKSKGGGQKGKSKSQGRR